MKITFFSTFLTHHQLPFCLEMQKKYGDNFKFVSTEKINYERINLGYKDLDNEYDFVVKAYESEELYKKAIQLANDSDIVIMGSTKTDEYIKQRLLDDKVIFRYYARIFYRGIFSFLDFKNLKIVYNKHFKYRNNKNMYLLCNNGYGPNDFNRFGMYINKCFKWGYFPETKYYDINELMNRKEKNECIKILWVGRFIKMKHPEYMIKLAKKLIKDGINFKIEMVGSGKLIKKIERQIEKNKLNNYIKLIGAVQSDKVREFMEKSNIFACTSNKEERWGVVINEAMNSACAVIANKDIGAVPVLIENNKNGVIYNGFNEFYNKIVTLIKNKELRSQISINAYKTISEIWTARNAVNNFDIMINELIRNKNNTIISGPASNAKPVKM